MLSRLVLALTTVAYPFLFVWLFNHWGLSAAVILLLVLALSRFLLNPDRIWGILLALTLVFIIAGVYFNNETALLFYPVLMNAAMLFIFAASIAAKQPIIEQFARLKDPNLSPQGVTYTKKLTYIWCVFFIINGCISTATCLINNLQIWALYNGCLSYVAMGILFAAEYVYRRLFAKV